jgi:hypothetical protein
MTLAKAFMRSTLRALLEEHLAVHHGVVDPAFALDRAADAHAGRRVLRELGEACVVALGAKVHIATELPENTLVPMGFIAYGSPGGSIPLVTRLLSTRNSRDSGS